MLELADIAIALPTPLCLHICQAASAAIEGRYSATMNLDDQMRRYFGTHDLAAVPGEALAAGLEHMRVDLGLERDRSRRFALWTLMYMLDAAPDLDVTFDDPADRDAARRLMELSERSLANDAD